MKEDKGGSKIECALDWHNDDYFGICRPYQVKHLDETQGKYKKPTTAEVRKHSAHIKTFRVKNLLKPNDST